MISLFLISPSSGDDLLDILNDSSKESSKKAAGSRKVHFSKLGFSNLLKRKTAEQNIFFQFIERGQFQKALYQWPSAFTDSAFSKRDDGKALYGFLLFKNGLELHGIETLFQARSQKVSQVLIKAWQDLLRDDSDHWEYTNIRWLDSWSNVFGVAAEVKVKARRFDRSFSSKEAGTLLRKTRENSWERDWLQWQYAVALVEEGKDIKAAKILKNLTAKEKSKVSKNLLWITAARILYQNGFLTEAKGYYRKVKKGSPYWFEAQEEIGWTSLRKGEPQNALAVTQSLLLDSLAADIGPMPFYQAALADLKICSYTDVSQTLNRFKDRFSKKALALIQLKEQGDTPASKKLLSHLQKSRVNMSKLGAHGSLLPRLSTKDEYLFYLAQRSQRLGQEAKTAGILYSQSLSQGTAFVGFQGPMEVFNNGAKKRAAESQSAALSRIKTLAAIEIDEIKGVLQKMQIVEAELIQQLALTELTWPRAAKLRKEFDREKYFTFLSIF